MKQKNPMKRLAINIVAVLIIAAVALLGFSSSTQSTARPGKAVDPPRLSATKVVEAKVDAAKVQVAIEIVSEDEPAIVADFVALYRWGRTKFGPVKCGKEYPPELCQYGEVHIFLIYYEEDVLTTAGPAGVPMTRLEIWLDQAQIDANLGPTVRLTSFAEIDKLHNSVAQQTQGRDGRPTGGGAEPMNEVFTGLK